ncbi:MAG TPA: hypothetical protein VIJ78_01770 [Pseudolabrys sp.]
MDHRSAFTSNREYATARLQGRGQPDRERVMAPQYSSCDIRRLPTGVIDYGFYREAAKRERDRAIMAFVRKFLGIFATLSRPMATDRGFAGTINTKRASV